MRRLLPLMVPLLLAGCARIGPAPAPHYVLGDAYQQGGTWYYPRENFALDTTGLAMVVERNGGLTADGEAFDQSALAAAHPTLQLPALARVTNLENGRQVLVRINDRGPGTPTRVLGITRRTALLLAAADPAAIRVRVQVLEAESRRMVAALRPEDAKLAIATVPMADISSESLTAPAGVPLAPARTLPSRAATPEAAAAALPEIPLRLPEAVTQMPVRPETLAIDCGGFASASPAYLLLTRVAALGGRVTTDYYAPRDRAYMVRIGPLPDVTTADAMLLRARAAGATDAHIVVQP